MKAFLYLTILTALVATQSGCQKEFKDSRAGLTSTGECVQTVSHNLNIAEASLNASQLGHEISSLWAQQGTDSKGSYLKISFSDSVGPFQITMNGPQAGLTQSASLEEYDFRYRCLTPDCYQLALLVTQSYTYSSGFGSISQESLGAVLQRDSETASTFHVICTSSNL